VHHIAGQSGTGDFQDTYRRFPTRRLLLGEGRDGLGPVPLPALGAEFDEARVQQPVQFPGRCADLGLKQPQLKVDHQLHVLIGLKAFHASGQ
jgi:hypothetical protein